jgi:hypothetical protein
MGRLAREGDGYVGWAPLPPAAVWRRGYGIPTRTIVIEPRHYCFVEARRVVEPHVDRYVAPPDRNQTILYNTTNVTHYTIVNHRVANHSIGEKTIERATGRPLPRYPVAEVESAAPRAFPARPDKPGSAVMRVEPSDRNGRPPHASVREAPPPAAEPGRPTRMDRDRSDQVDRERAAVERRNAARLQDERRRQDESRALEAAHERDREREREALQRQQTERQGQELRRRQELERSREAARQQAMQREQIERVREGAEHKAREDAIRRQQAEAQRHPPPQPQRQPLGSVQSIQPQHQPPLPVAPGQP